MKATGIIPFRLGHATSKKLKSNFLAFYKWIADSHLGGKCKIINENDLYTIPVTNRTMFSDPFMPNREFTTKIELWGSNPDLVIIDLSNPPHKIIRGGFLIQLASAIHSFQSQDKCNTRCLILLPELLPEKEVARNILKNEIENGVVTFVADSGDILGVKLSDKFTSAEYHKRLLEVREDPYRLLYLKMVRRLGHFFRKYGQDHYRCARYYFDGRLCIDELVILTRLYVAQHCEGKHEPFILYDAPFSPWFEEVMLALDNDGVVVQTTKAYLTKEGEKYNPATMKPFLFVPMVDTGETLAKILNDLAILEDGITPQILSVLTTRSDDNTARKRILNIGGQEIKIDFFLEVQQQSFVRDDCPLCRYGVPETTQLYEDDSFLLPTWDKWDMVYEEGVGWKNEDDVPPYRESLPKVPRYPELVEKNGPLLATKFHSLLDHVLGGCAFPFD